VKSNGLGPTAVQAMIDAGGSTDYLDGYTMIGASSTWTRTGTGSIWLTAPSNGAAVSVKAAVWAVSGSTWTHSFEIGRAIGGVSSTFGIIVRDSASGRIVAGAIDSAFAGHIYRFTLTGFVSAGTTSNNAPAVLDPTIYMTVTYDGTNLAFYAGYGLGDRAVLIGTEAVATYLAATPDQVGVYVDPYNGACSVAVAARMAT
jgi:hypothetical protein